jgi:benzoate-CoA ligase family protein
MKIADLPLHYNCIDILEHNLPQRADKVALYSLERELTFRQMSQEVNQVGNALRKLGVRIGDYVAILSLDLPEWVTSFFGTLKIGGVAVGMNTTLTPSEYAYMLDDCRARVLIVHDSLLPRVEEIRAARPFLEHVIVIGSAGSARGVLLYDEWITGESTELSAARTHRDDVCTLNYTSGTTGPPKGIQHAHKDMPISSQLYTVNVLGLKESDRTFSVARLFFTYGLGVNLFSSWHVGAGMVLSSRPPRIATSILETIDRFKPTFLFSVPTSYASLLAVDNFDQYDLSSLRMCVAAGEVLPASLWHAWKKRTGLEILESMGTTEAFALFLSNHPGDIRHGTVGRCVEGFEIKIADENGVEVSRGEIGDMFVKGETFSLFYLHQYHKTQQMFRGEWLLTGDKFYQDEDGCYHYAGRVDEMLKAGGIWVSPAEIEQTLRTHEAVFECAVFGYPDRDELIKPKAFVALRRGYTASDELANELIEYCKSKMASYKRPRWIEFRDELPKTATGKIQRSALRHS